MKYLFIDIETTGLPIDENISPMDALNRVNSFLIDIEDTYVINSRKTNREIIYE